MKLKKAEVCVLVVTLLFLALTLGYQLGQRRSPAPFSVRTSAESVLQQPAESDGAGLRSMTGAELPAAVNLNTAGKEELCALNGIGEVLAERIIAYREEHGKFSARKELLKVPKLGPKAYEQSAGRVRQLCIPRQLQRNCIDTKSPAQRVCCTGLL